jgi:predicted membrane-bound spermidine synthase
LWRENQTTFLWLYTRKSFTWEVVWFSYHNSCPKTFEFVFSFFSNKNKPNLNIKRGAFLIGIIGVVASVVTECFYYNEQTRVYFHIALSLVAFFCYIGILLAYHSERVIYYTPFFIVIVSFFNMDYCEMFWFRNIWPWLLLVEKIGVN